MVTIVYIKWQRKYTLNIAESLNSERSIDDIFSFFIIFPCSCKDHPTRFSVVPCDSPALSLCEYLPFRSDMKQFHHATAGKQNVLTRGLCSPHRNPCPLNFHNLTPQGQNHSQSDHMAVLSWHGYTLLSLSITLLLSPFPFCNYL